MQPFLISHNPVALVPPTTVTREYHSRHSSSLQVVLSRGRQALSARPQGFSSAGSSFQFFKSQHNLGQLRVRPLQQALVSLMAREIIQTSNAAHLEFKWTQLSLLLNSIPKASMTFLQSMVYSRVRSPRCNSFLSLHFLWLQWEEDADRPDSLPHPPHGLSLSDTRVM